MTEPLTRSRTEPRAAVAESLAALEREVIAPGGRQRATLLAGGGNTLSDENR
jgi:hypothetical protein